MNTIKTLLYMGSLHGFFTVYFPYRLSSLDAAALEMGWLRVFAVPFWALGALTILRCSADLVHRGAGTPAHADPPRRLVVDGLYRHVRNPIYAGALLFQIGYILWFGSGWLLLYCLAFLLAFHTLVVAFEEPVLRHTFGTAYEEYCRSVPRWIPRFL
jgi:protein-S-isoprenylcysteine O-methyltransferase Ste14